MLTLFACDFSKLQKNQRFDPPAKAIALAITGRS